MVAEAEAVVGPVDDDEVEVADEVAGEVADAPEEPEAAVPAAQTGQGAGAEVTVGTQTAPLAENMLHSANSRRPGMSAVHSGRAGVGQAAAKPVLAQVEGRSSAG